MIEIGLKYTSELTVTDAVTAIAVGSGDMPDLATPMMMALMENVAMLAVKNELPDGSLSCHFPISADYDGIGPKGTKFVFYV